MQRPGVDVRRVLISAFLIGNILGVIYLCSKSSGTLWLSAAPWSHSSDTSLPGTPHFSPHARNPAALSLPHGLLISADQVQGATSSIQRPKAEAQLPPYASVSTWSAGTFNEVQTRLQSGDAGAITPAGTVQSQTQPPLLRASPPLSGELRTTDQPPAPPPPPRPGCVDQEELGSAFSRLPEEYGPDAPAWNNSIAVCACIRDENITDIREWVQYYRWLGVDHVFITENNSQRPIKEGLQDFVDSGFVTYRTDSTPYAQMRIYAWCMQEHRFNFNWMAFFDADEILVIRRKGLALKTLLGKFKYHAGLAVHWVNMGSSGWDRRPPEGGMLRHYTLCDPTPDISTKMIANMYYTAGVARNPHTARFWDCMTSVNEVKRRFPFHQDGTGVPENLSMDPRVDRIALFHYAAKSREDFSIKVARGGGGGKAKSWAFFDKMDEHQQQHPLCLEASRVADECCSIQGATPPETSTSIQVQ